MSNFLIAVLPVIGVIIGILLQTYLGKFNYKKQLDSQRRHDIYSNYLEAVANRDIPLLTKAKTKMAIVGSPEVLEAISEFEHQGPVLDNDKSGKRFLAIVQAMRRETSAYKNVAKDQDLRTILFGPTSFE